MSRSVDLLLSIKGSSAYRGSVLLNTLPSSTHITFGHGRRPSQPSAAKSALHYPGQGSADHEGACHPTSSPTVWSVPKD